MYGDEEFEDFYEDNPVGIFEKEEGIFSELSPAQIDFLEELGIDTSDPTAALEVSLDIVEDRYHSVDVRFMPERFALDSFAEELRFYSFQYDNMLSACSDSGKAALCCFSYDAAATDIFDTDLDPKFAWILYRLGVGYDDLDSQMTTWFCSDKDLVKKAASHFYDADKIIPALNKKLQVFDYQCTVLEEKGKFCIAISKDVVSQDVFPGSQIKKEAAALGMTVEEYMNRCKEVALQVDKTNERADQLEKEERISHLENLQLLKELASLAPEVAADFEKDHPELSISSTAS